MSESGKHFSIDLPDGWVDKTVHTFMGPDDSGVQHILTLVLDDDTESMDLEEFARERIDVIVDSMSAITVLKDEPKELAGGKTVHEFVYKWVPVDDKIIFQKVIYLLIDGVGYTFSCNYSKKTIKTIGLEVEKIIESFIPAGMEMDAE